MGVHKASNNQGAWETRDDSDVDPGGVGPAADPLRPEGGREDERVDETRPPVPSELLSFKPKQPGFFWIKIHMDTTLGVFLGAAPQTP